jgi:hypothetical protein
LVCFSKASTTSFLEARLLMPLSTAK